MKKYKIKTHKSTVKRFKITGSGKVIRQKQQERNNSHLRSFKNRKQKSIRKDKLVISSKGNIRKIKKLIVS
ncbi:50S ribosomal protein L35 [Candidatus Dojkabacteria bacterium]|uniref:50S ribosomal protein L35 n=1 Tax=Candidatus Dojkabacteria bacterium TaxID=2099670 RepID=A0A3M0Z1T2_9BACT|nr:MAG: 50S ribosomal protein L35 [Candidatus Dojkabacteria bacterium]